MNAKTKDDIEAYLKRTEFFKLSGKDVWVAGKAPHQRICDLSIDPPWIGINTGTQRIEAENCGIIQVQDIKTAVLNMYNNDIKKPTEQVKSPSEAPSPQEEPPEPDATPAAKPSSVGESHPFICYTCQAGISAEQRNSSFKEHKKALCEKCIVAPPDKEKPKEELKPEPAKETKKEEEKKKTMPEKEEKKGANVPAVQEKPATSDQQIDEMIERAKARKFLEGQGSSYKVQGKERPDSAMIQKISNEAGISTEILRAEQTSEYAHVVVRGHLDNRYVDAVVHHDFDTEFQLKMMEIISKNPQILDHYEGSVPVIKERAQIRQGDDMVDAKYYLAHALLSFKKFSLRDATSKAMAITQMKLLNRDSRDESEKQSEEAERHLVEKNKKVYDK